MPVSISTIMNVFNVPVIDCLCGILQTRKRQPRTAARRTHVRASVRARLADLHLDQRQDALRGASGGHGLSAHRQKAGIPSLSLFGNSNQLDYFSEDEQDVSESAGVAVAVRSTSNILSAYRQVVF